MSIIDKFKKKKDYIKGSDRKYAPLFEAYKLTDRYKEKGFSKMKIDIFSNSAYPILTKEALEAIEMLNIPLSMETIGTRELIKELPTLMLISMLGRVSITPFL